MSRSLTSWLKKKNNKVAKSHGVLPFSCVLLDFVIQSVYSRGLQPSTWRLAEHGTCRSWWLAVMVHAGSWSLPLACFRLSPPESTSSSLGYTSKPNEGKVLVHQVDPPGTGSLETHAIRKMRTRDLKEHKLGLLWALSSFLDTTKALFVNLGVSTFRG